VDRLPARRKAYRPDVVVSLERPPERPAETAPSATAPSRLLLAFEVLVVLGLSLGKAAAVAIAGFYTDQTGGTPGQGHGAILYASEAPGRPLLDLVRQLMDLGFAAVPVALAAYLLVRSGDGVRGPWFGGRLRLSDLGWGALTAAGVAAVGLPFYLANHATTGATVVPETLPDVWWRIPVLVLAAFQNGLLEECVLLGFVFVRLRQLGLAAPATIGLLAVVRASYHLYQGVGGALGNLLMGVLFGWLYHRWGRVTPLVIAHTLIDIGAYLGFLLLAGRVSWVPA
jgi:membrane protease YdiL (CAAX protease family)